MARHLTNSEILNEKYLSLVPDKLPHMEFWKRYLFKRALLEDALAHAEMAERRAKAEIRSTKTISPKRAAEIIQTEQPKTIQADDDKGEDEKVEKVEPAKDGMLHNVKQKFSLELKKLKKKNSIRGANHRRYRYPMGCRRFW